MPKFIPLPQRLEANSVQVGTCRRWIGAHRGRGYGAIQVRGKSVAVHRIAYEVAFGAIPPGKEIDHVAERGCRFRDCIEPSHLEAVTHQENLRRAFRTDTHVPMVTCTSGHEFTADNTYVAPSGRRMCRTCKRRHNIEHKRRMRARATGVGDA